uniref:CCHC-type domain-containing protein n=1 Tax=Strigamia maritima TaxID=126957 RepID=T1IWU9_STRMM
MWDYEENLDDVHYYNTNEDDIEDDDDADSEVEALMYSNIHYQGDFTRNDERNVSIIQPEVVQNVEKRMKKVKIDKSNKKMVKKKPETNYGVEKLTQFVSVVKHNPRARSKDPGSSSQEVVVISSDSDVKVVDVVKSNRKIVETKKKKKEEKGIFVSDSDSDSFFEGNDVGVDLPVDININISARSGYNEEMSEICSKKEKIGEISAKKRKISDVFTPVKKKIRKSGDFSVDYAEKMRKFYDSESSEDEIEVAKLDLVQGSWKIDDSDRFGWISDKKRFFGGGFTPKIKVKCRNCQQWGHFERDCQEKIVNLC